MSLVARLRLAFRQIVWLSAVILPISGLFSMYQLWPQYFHPTRPTWTTAFPWAMAHMVGGCIVVVIAVLIVAGRRVPDRARGWLKVNFVFMLAVMLRNRPDVGSALRGVGALTGVFARTETVCDLLSFSDFAGTSTCSAAPGGLGGVPGRPATACSERNVLREPGDPYARGTTAGENVWVHELAHTIMNVGLSDQDRLQIGQRFDAATTGGLWTGDYAVTNADEFFAEMSQVYFCANPAVPTFLHTHGINCSTALRDYDLPTFLLIDGIYRGTSDLR